MLNDDRFGARTSLEEHVDVRKSLASLEGICRMTCCRRKGWRRLYDAAPPPDRLLAPVGSPVRLAVASLAAPGDGEHLDTREAG